MRTRKLNKRKQYAGSYLDKYKWTYIPIVKRIIKNIGKEKYVKSKYLNIQLMDDDFNSLIKDFCENDAFLEIFETIQEKSEIVEILDELDENEITENAIKKLNLGSYNNINKDYEKIKRISLNYTEYNKFLKKLTDIITLGIVDIFDLMNRDVMDWEDEIHNIIVKDILPNLMKSYLR